MAEAPADERTALRMALRSRAEQLVAERAQSRRQTRAITAQMRREARKRSQMLKAARALDSSDLALILRARGHQVVLVQEPQ